MTTWEEIDAAVKVLENDPEARVVHAASLAKLRPLTGAGLGNRLPDSQDNMEWARFLLAAIDVMRKDPTPASINQSGWTVDTVINAAQATVRVAVTKDTAELLAKAIARLNPAPAGIRVDVVLVVMTRQQGEELRNGRAFEALHQSLANEFASLQSHLDKQGTAEWLERYGDSPTDWRPFGHADATGATIGTHIRDQLGDMNRKLGLDPPLTPVFHDIHRLVASDSDAALRELRREGCLVIIDSMSLRHPAVLHDLQRSLLDVYPGSAVYALAPNDVVLPMLEDMTHGLELKMRDSELKRRIDNSRYEEVECAALALTDPDAFSYRMVKSVQGLYRDKFKPPTAHEYFNRWGRR